MSAVALVHSLYPLLLLDPDLEAETVAGVTLRRLTGAGTVPFGTLWENILDKSSQKLCI